MCLSRLFSNFLLLFLPCDALQLLRSAAKALAAAAEAYKAVPAHTGELVWGLFLCWALQPLL
jgi:hypothetical protein